MHLIVSALIPGVLSKVKVSSLGSGCVGMYDFLILFQLNMKYVAVVSCGDSMVYWPGSCLPCPL